jgi:hypothetical protein
VRGRHWFSKHLVYRVLAETMRTKFYLRLAAADRHLKAEDLIILTGIDQFEGFSWITNVLKNVEPFVERQAPDQAEAGKIDLHRAWIDGQGLLQVKVKRLEETYHRLEQMKGFLFVTLVIIIDHRCIWWCPARDGAWRRSLLKDAHVPDGPAAVWLGIPGDLQNKMATGTVMAVPQSAQPLSRHGCN